MSGGRDERLGLCAVVGRRVGGCGVRAVAGAVVTGKLAQQFAQVRDNMFGCVLHWQGPILGCDTCRDSASALAALSAIERWATDVALHVKDTERVDCSAADGWHYFEEGLARCRCGRLTA